MRKIFRILIDVPFYTILIALVAYMVLGIFGIKFYNVPTGSMEPNIHANSLVMVNNKADYNDIEVGDVIVFTRQSDDIMIIHRVIEKTEEGLFTKGDANQSPDGICITSDMFVGKFIFDIPHLGKFFDWLDASPLNKILYVSGMLILTGIDFVLAENKEKRK